MEEVTLSLNSPLKLFKQIQLIIHVLIHLEAPPSPADSILNLHLKLLDLINYS